MWTSLGRSCICLRRRGCMFLILCLWLLSLASCTGLNFDEEGNILDKDLRELLAKAASMKSLSHNNKKLTSEMSVILGSKRLLSVPPINTDTQEQFPNHEHSEDSSDADKTSSESLKLELFGDDKFDKEDGEEGIKLDAIQQVTGARNEEENDGFANNDDGNKITNSESSSEEESTPSDTIQHKDNLRLDLEKVTEMTQGISNNAQNAKRILEEVTTKTSIQEDTEMHNKQKTMSGENITSDDEEINVRTVTSITKKSTTVSSDMTTTTTTTTAIKEPEKKTKPNDNTSENGNGENANDSIQIMDEIALYPWETAACWDDDPVACKTFKHLCNIMEKVGHDRCRKTCSLCVTDKPTAKVLIAKFKNIDADLELIQHGPQAPVFMKMCVSKSEVMLHNFLKIKHEAVIYTYAEAKVIDPITREVTVCGPFMGPHYNPYGTLHGSLIRESGFHLGDLGKLEFGSVPENWPREIPRCAKTALGSYAMFHHINLYRETSPLGKPVAITVGEDTITGFAKRDIVDCTTLKSPTSQKAPTEDSSKKPDTIIPEVKNVTREQGMGLREVEEDSKNTVIEKQGLSLTKEVEELRARSAMDQHMIQAPNTISEQDTDLTEHEGNATSEKVTATRADAKKVASDTGTVKTTFSEQGTDLNETEEEENGLGLLSFRRVPSTKKQDSTAEVEDFSAKTANRNIKSLTIEQETHVKGVEMPSSLQLPQKEKNRQMKHKEMTGDTKITPITTCENTES